MAVGNAFALEAQGSPRVGAARHFDRDLTAQGRNLDRGAQHRFRKADRQFQVDVRFLPDEEGVLLDMDLDDRVAGGSPAHSRYPLALQAQLLLIFRTRRDRDIDALAGR